MVTINGFNHGLTSAFASAVRLMPNSVCHAVGVATNEDIAKGARKVAFLDTLQRTANAATMGLLPLALVPAPAAVRADFRRPLLELLEQDLNELSRRLFALFLAGVSTLTSVITFSIDSSIFASLTKLALTALGCAATYVAFSAIALVGAPSFVIGLACVSFVASRAIKRAKENQIENLANKNFGHVPKQIEQVHVGNYSLDFALGLT